MQFLCHQNAAIRVQNTAWIGYHSGADLKFRSAAPGSARLALPQEVAMAKLTLEQAFELAAQEHQRGNLKLAHSLYSQILRIHRDHADALHLLGVACGQLGDSETAAEHIKRAIAIRPVFPAAYGNLGNVLHDLGRMDDALPALREAIRQNPRNANAFSTLGNVCRDLALLDEAISHYRTALSIQPNYVQAHSNLLFTLMFHPSHSAETIAAEAARWNARHAEPLMHSIEPHSNDRSPDRPLRIGYVGSDFRNHCQSLFTLPLFKFHDRSDCQIFCYSSVDRPDEISRQIQSTVDQWRNATPLSDEQLAAQIRSDKIDILVDLSMHMNRGRLLAFARKPAPVQVTWLAYPGTTGMKTMDYRLTDTHLDPPGINEACYSEKTIRLPDKFWCYDAMETDLSVNNPPAQDRGYTTFGCLNNYCKVNDETLKRWGEVLRAVPDSRLLLLCPKGAHRQNAIDALGIAHARIEFIERLPRREYLKTYHRIDICLDTFPYNGHTTSLDALWMGVPVITLCGTTVVSRAGLSQMTNLGLGMLVARSPAEFLDIAVSLALDPQRLRALRVALRNRMESSPLMDANRFARGMDHTFRRLWRNWCETAPP